MSQEQTVDRRRKSRSPSYPALDLEAAISRAEQLYSKEQKHFTPIEAILQDWGYSPKSSGGMLAVAALKKFGLLEDQGSGDKRQGRLTSLALRIVLDDRPESQERLAAIREAALSPTIHSELWEEHDGSLPPDVNLRYKLRVEKGFTDSAANELIEEFRRTIEFAKLEDVNAVRTESRDTTSAGGESRTTIPVGTQAIDRYPPIGQVPSQGSGSRIVPLPLSPSTWVTLEGSFPLSIEDWERLIQLLDVMKPGLTESPETPLRLEDPYFEVQSPSLTEDAQELLRKVDEGGVPAYVTSNLRKVAEENGIVVTTSTTPNEIIEALQQMALDSD